MPVTALERWRDAALILLAGEAFCLALVVGVVLYLGLRGLRALQGWLRPKLRLGATYVHRTRDITLRLLARLAEPFVGLHALTIGLREALHVLRGR